MSSSALPNIDFTPEDYNRSKILDQGWYSFKVKDIQYVVNKEDSSKHNYMWDFVGNPGSAAENVPVTRYFPDSAKARGYMIPFINACAGKKVVTDKGGSLSPSACIGKSLELFIKPGEFGGNTKNDVGGCRELQNQPVSAPANV